MPKTFYFATKILVILLIPLWITIGSIRLLATSEYLGIEYNKADYPEDSFGLSKDKRLGFASENLRYLRDNLPISALENQTNGGEPLYNDRELKHMEDVQSVMQFFWAVWKVISLLIGILIILTLIRLENRKAFASGLKIGGFLTAGFIASIGLLAVVGWDTWFLIFHKLLFAPGSWTFYFSDTLIRLFPLKFWMDAVYTVTGLSLAGGLLVGFAGWYWQTHNYSSVQYQMSKQKSP